MSEFLLKVDYKYHTPLGRARYNYDIVRGVSQMKALDEIKRKIRRRTRLNYNDVTILKIKFNHLTAKAFK